MSAFSRNKKSTPALFQDNPVIDEKRSMDSPWRRSLRALTRNKMAMLGAAIIAIWALLAITAPIVAPYDPLHQDVTKRLNPPSRENLFGTDELGRDLFSRVLYGARISIPTGVLVILVEMVIGSVIGAVSAYMGGFADILIMRFADVTLSFPAIVLALAIASALGPSLQNTMLALILVLWPEYARLMRSEVLKQKRSDYVLAAQCLGVPGRRILFSHILPNSISTTIVKGSLDAGNVILFIAALSFIGLGVVPPTPEWGAMISAGRLKFYDWWLTTFPGLAMLSVVLALNLIGDGARDAFDPRVVGR
ncbi:MAG: ABC transporter permease [Anaerolineales bacterium]|nr:ABC transporter permease [Anaerolineales bacterium]